MFSTLDYLTGFDKGLTVGPDGPRFEERPNTFEYNQKEGTIKPITKDEGDNE